jgi:hypothetical protein
MKLSTRRKFFVYCTKYGGVIQIKARRRPSEKTATKQGTWIIEKLQNGKWERPYFPEIFWLNLRNMTYLGCRSCSDEVQNDSN